MYERILRQFFSISSSVIISGGAIRMQFGANKNQSDIMPFSMHRLIILLQVSKLSNSKESHKPAERTDLIFLC